MSSKLIAINKFKIKYIIQIVLFKIYNNIAFQFSLIIELF